jgi:truncated hemoglobin YjbI
MNQPLTLFDKLGGKPGIKTFVDLVIAKVSQDPTLNIYFVDTNMELLMEKLRFYLEYLTGGQRMWIGQSLHEAHKALKITDTVFDTFVSHCV